MEEYVVAFNVPESQAEAFKDWLLKCSWDFNAGKTSEAFGSCSAEITEAA